MKITLFTANLSRHNYLINLLSKSCEELFVVQESRTIFPGIVPGHYNQSDTMKKYFLMVNEAQSNIFGNSFIQSKNNNINILPITPADLEKCTTKNLSEFLNSDLYIVFGSSYIKGELVDFLIKKKAVNIHMGISPYYRGTDCNFWALFDNNYHLAGATIHLLSKGLDSGPILYHALSEFNSNLFYYTMSTVKSAFHSLADRINNKSIFDIKPVPQNKDIEIRYTKKNDFNDRAIKIFSEKKINYIPNKFDLSLFKDPYILNN